jgi:N-acetylmuramoyl-L-alanine amidase
MRRVLAIALLSLLLGASAVHAVGVVTPQGKAEVFSKGGLLDVVELLRLSGAEVGFAAAAGSYTASLAEHQLQFTPGGSLAVVDGRLSPLPGPIRAVEGHIVGAFATAAALLHALGWTLSGTAEAPVLGRTSAGEQIEVAVVRTPAGATVVVCGSAQKPRVSPASGVVKLQYVTRVQLARPIPVEAELLGGELADNVLTLRFATGVEVASSYTLDDPPRLVLRLGSTQAPAAVAARSGPLVVLDPGHGGEDQGAKGPNGLLEKDVTLAVAKAAAAQLQAAGITTRLTRESDESVALADRTALANRLTAIAFVSIHANASPAKGVRGAETYYMSADASDHEAAAAAARENASAPPDTVQLILWDLAHVANLNESARLARSIQERLNAVQGIKDRGVRQAPFVVLTGATMPAALVEIGFLSNAEDATRISARDEQDKIVAAITDAVVEFVRTPRPTAPPSPSPSAAP